MVLVVVVLEMGPPVALVVLETHQALHRHKETMVEVVFQLVLAGLITVVVAEVEHLR